ncbi:hypothetical protein MJL48_35130, partial [Salmonella enterica subsp. enterica serovar Kentucky]|nr:hypothetical protein [Salmonella enterica subsp. enterica serovar Kentucky]
ESVEVPSVGGRPPRSLQRQTLAEVIEPRYTELLNLVNEEILQRKASKPGEGLGKTTGWIHRATLLARGVKMIPAVSYQKIDD